MTDDCFLYMGTGYACNVDLIFTILQGVIFNMVFYAVVFSQF